jgi:hypothetical protein
MVAYRRMIESELRRLTALDDVAAGTGPAVERAPTVPRPAKA